MAEGLSFGGVMSATVPTPKDSTLAAPNPWTTCKMKRAARLAGSAASRILAAMYISNETM
jgi:hypothetical protein